MSDQALAESCPSEVALDNYLSEYQQVWLAAVEPDADDDFVQVTPFTDGACSSRGPLRLPKSSIIGIKKTGRSSQVCGRLADLVEVRFQDGLRFSYEQVMEEAREFRNSAPSALISAGAPPTFLPSLLDPQEFQRLSQSEQARVMQSEFAKHLRKARDIEFLGIYVDVSICFCVNGTPVCCGYSTSRGLYCETLKINCGPLRLE